MRHPHRCSRRRLARPVVPAALLLVAMAYPAALVGAEPPTWQQEAELEASCESWQHVRRCSLDGEVALECAAKGPMAKFLSIFRRHREDDDVWVVVLRDSEPANTSRTPEVASEAPGEAASPAEGAEVRTNRRVVRRGDAEHLPVCHQRR